MGWSHTKCQYFTEKSVWGGHTWQVSSFSTKKLKCMGRSHGTCHTFIRIDILTLQLVWQIEGNIR